MPFSFRLYEPAADVSFLSIVDGEALFNSSDRVSHDAREATLQQIGWHPVRLPEDWFLSERHHATANRVLETMQCTLQYLHYSQRKAEKELRKATQTLTRYQEERDDAFEEIVTLRETLALYKKRTSLSRDPPGRGGSTQGLRQSDQLVCSLCGNDYPSVHSLESHIKKRHRRTGDFATLAASLAAVAWRASENARMAGGHEDFRRDDQSSTRMVQNLTEEVSALRLQVAKLMGEAADQRQAFSPVHLVGMPLGTLPGQAANEAVQRNRTAAHDRTEDQLQRVTESLQAATAKMAEMEKTLSALHKSSQPPPRRAPDGQTSDDGPAAVSSQGSSRSWDRHKSHGVLGVLPLATRAQLDVELLAQRRGSVVRPRGLSPTSLTQQRAQAEWDVIVSPMTQMDPSPRNSAITRPHSTVASRTSVDAQTKSKGNTASHGPSAQFLKATPGSRGLSSVSSSRDSSAWKDTGAIPQLALTAPPPADTTIAMDGDHSEVVVSARRGSSIREEPAPLAVALGPREASASQDRYSLTPGDALSTSITPRGRVMARRRSCDYDDSSTSQGSRRASQAGDPHGDRDGVVANSLGVLGTSPDRSSPSLQGSSSAAPDAPDVRVQSSGDAQQSVMPSALPTVGPTSQGPLLTLSPESKNYSVLPSPSDAGMAAKQNTHTPPKVHLVQSVDRDVRARGSNGSVPRSAQDRNSDRNHSTSSHPAVNRSDDSPLMSGPAVAAGSPEGTRTMQVGPIDSLPQSTVKPATQQESPLAWSSSQPSSSGHTPPPLAHVTPLKPRFLEGAADDSTITDVRLPTRRSEAAESAHTERSGGDRTVERPSRPDAVGDASANRSGSGGYSYYYTYSSTTPSDARTGGSGSSSRPSPEAARSDAQGPPSSKRGKKSRSMAETRYVSELPRSSIVTDRGDAEPEAQESKASKAKGVFKSLFGAKKKKAH